MKLPRKERETRTWKNRDMDQDERGGKRTMAKDEETSTEVPKLG